MIFPSTFETVRFLDPDYLHFVAAIGWLVNAGLVLFFLIPRQGATSSVADRGFWLTVSSAFTALGVAAAALLLETYASLFVWPRIPEMVGHVGAGCATMLAVAALPRPQWFLRPALWRWCIGGGAVACIVVLSQTPIAFGWWILPTAGGGGLYMIVWAMRPSVAADGPRQGRTMYLLLGVMLLSIAASFGVAHLISRGPEWPDRSGLILESIRTWQSVVLGIAAWSVFLGIWLLFLRKCTQPAIRARPGLVGMRPAIVLPVLEFVVIAGGGYLFALSTREAERYVGNRVLSEVRAVSLAVSDAGAEATYDPGSDPALARDRTLRRTLDRLLVDSETYLSATLWRIHEGRTEVGAAVSKGYAGRRFDVAALLLEEEALAPVHAEGGLVRWVRGEVPFHAALVVVPARMGRQLGGDWNLSLVVDSRDLSNLIASHRLQTLAIIALAVIIVAFAVVYTIRTLNEAEFRLLKERAEAENTARNAFLGMISHEIRTPLQSVLGHAELAESQNLPDPVARSVRAIRTQGAMLLRIVQDILDFSAVRGGGFTLNAEPVSLRDLVRDVENALASRAEAKGIALSSEVDGSVPAWVMVDRVRLAQVMLNLAGNAVKFTQRGGVRLSVTARRVRGEDVEVEASVVDTGPGISAAQMRRLFEPFRKMRDDDTPGGGGVGLGLAISRQIVDRLGGTLDAESVEGEGATFRVRLRMPVTPGPIGPADGEPALAAAPRDATGGNSLAGLRVLLIDDNPYVRELLRDFLRMLGAEVCVRPDGATALEAYRAGAFDVVLLDLRLPDVSGEEFAATLRREGRSEIEPWIVAISAGVSDEEIQRTLATGVNDFMLKPVSIAGLAETLRMSPLGDRLTGAPACALPGIPADSRERFRTEIGPLMYRIEAACRERRARTLAAEAHYLANGCMVLGLDEGLSLCRDIETAAGQGEFTVADQLIASLRRVVGQAGEPSAGRPCQS